MYTFFKSFDYFLLSHRLLVSLAQIPNDLPLNPLSALEVGFCEAEVPVRVTWTYNRLYGEVPSPFSTFDHYSRTLRIWQIVGVSRCPTTDSVGT